MILGQDVRTMKWIAIISLITIVLLFYLMGDRQEYDVDEQTTQEGVRYSQDDTFEELDQGDDKPQREAVWLNQRAEKILPLGSNIN